MHVISHGRHVLPFKKTNSIITSSIKMFIESSDLLSDLFRTGLRTMIMAATNLYLVEFKEIAIDQNAVNL